MKNLPSYILTIVMITQLAVACSPKKETTAKTVAIHPQEWPTTNGGVPLDPQIETKIDELLATLSIEEMVGQTIQADIGSITPEELRKYRLGSILNGGNSAPGNNVRAEPLEWLKLADAFFAASMDTTKGRKAIPLLWGTDAVHGHNNIVGATIFPHNIGLGAMRNPDLIRKIGTVTAKEVIVTGMDWTFAPTLAVVRDDRWGRTYEGYSEDPEIVAQYAGEMVEGLQGSPGSPEFLNSEHVLATAKHFMGDGGTQYGRDQGDNIDSEKDFRKNHGAGYPPSINAGVQTVMASFSSWHGKRMHGNKDLLTEVLKNKMGFNGFVVGDWNGHGQVVGSDKTSSPASINAGLDMFMAPDSWKGLYKNTLAQAKSGEIPRERLRDAVRRILRVKFRLGLFEKPMPSGRPLAGNFSLLGNPDHLAVARQAVRESLVLLKNQNALLPLAANQRILVTGDGADDIGKQSGGWTYSWQGTSNTRKHFPNGQSIWEGIQATVEAGGGKAILSQDGEYEEKPDVAIIVFGEKPYAEFVGDITNLNFQLDQNIENMRAFKEAGIPVVSIFLSGRPLWVNPALNASDAFVAAWLPGSQGAGVSDVLIRNADGSIAYDFKGKLSFSWPQTASQTSLNRHDQDYNPLFPYGYGLTYSDNGNLDELSEDPKLSGEVEDKTLFFDKGRSGSLWIVKGMSGEASRIVDGGDVQVSSGLRIKSIDRVAQEDARQLTWTGEEEASVVITTDQVVDLSREANGDMALSLQLKVDKKPDGPVKMFVNTGNEDLTELDVTELLSKAPLNQWMKLDIKLSCFKDAGADFTQLNTIFGLKSSDPFVFSFYSILLTTNEGEAICP